MPNKQPAITVATPEYWEEACKHLAFAGGERRVGFAKGCQRQGHLILLHENRWQHPGRGLAR